MPMKSVAFLPRGINNYRLGTVLIRKELIYIFWLEEKMSS